MVKSSLAGKLVKCNNSDQVVTDIENPFYGYGYLINKTISVLFNSI